ncbi:MAG: DUF421 domain-containing protein [Firmicutes bacterium]|uniref:Uncharacterized membrane protein YcaP, DUF421 family n=1 Tax=Melghirimyces thermohalophilus TaxID=1236220 RepID=A0A1G6QI77_9BACL|nr:DUF421 domain-containing protein [Melghirimyces thermohalophilus]MDA8352058.1 DUF421 domain-containing protein [Bacillota bacterium]SDC91387.1 Uncharacterized membrane protein YcaP, DUF421 family [Melghirimyces thermohalophilus]
MLYILKVALLFTAAITALRLMGKSTMAQVTPHDLMAIVVIAALATNPILETELDRTLLGILVVTGLHIAFAKLTLYRRTNTWILGEPTILIKRGKMIRENLARCEISVSELISTIRSKGYPDLRQVQYAILEPTGDMSILPSPELNPVTVKDLKLPDSRGGIAISLVVDGQIQQGNLKLIGKDEDWLKQTLRQQGYRNLQEILYAAKQKGEERIYVDTGDGNP